jgi:hypothetical protein
MRCLANSHFVHLLFPLATCPQVVMTFTLISVVYACGIAKPGHGSLTPIAVGFSLIACAGAGAKYTGKSSLGVDVSTADIKTDGPCTPARGYQGMAKCSPYHHSTPS